MSLVIQSGQSAAQQALDAVPTTTERGGRLAVPAPRATEGELKHALIALKNPPQRGDPTGVFATFAGAGAAIAKVAKDCASGTFDLLSVAVVMVAGIAIFASVRKYFEAERKPHPFHDQVIKDIEAVLAEAGPQSRKGDKFPGEGTPP